MENNKAELRYIDLKSDICEQIYKGIYRDGERIPSERQLTIDYDVSRITVRKALELLEEENLVKREIGNGTIIQYRNWGNENSLDMLALVAPSKNPFFSRFIAEFQKIAWEHDTLILYVEIPEQTSLEDCLYRLYKKNIRNAVVWPDDQKINKEKLLRLRSIGMNLVFFDTDEGYPYADCVYLDNEDAIIKLISTAPKAFKNYIYVGWDKLDIGNVRKREGGFKVLCPKGDIIRVPWRRDRKILNDSLQHVEDSIQRSEDSVIVCGAGEIGQQIAEYLKLRKKESVSMAVIDEFDGSEKYTISLYEQNLAKTAETIYQKMCGQIQDGRQWQAELTTVKGIYKEK